MLLSHALLLLKSYWKARFTLFRAAWVLSLRRGGGGFTWKWVSITEAVIWNKAWRDSPLSQVGQNTKMAANARQLPTGTAPASLDAANFPRFRVHEFIFSIRGFNRIIRFVRSSVWLLGPISVVDRMNVLLETERLKSQDSTSSPTASIQRGQTAGLAAIFGRRQNNPLLHLMTQTLMQFAIARKQMQKTKTEAKACKYM